MMHEHERGMLPVGALVLILIGAFWILQDMHYLPADLSIWPIILIVIGIGLLVNNYWKTY
ncbi:Uncharacterised protein [Candidatus Tiddalikarchaeum anstoanum]|nr:Uncharacterised protein [Candidatus Tiddalikarchaeum anstoanum]